MKCVLVGGGMVAKTHLLALRDNVEGVELHAVVGRRSGKVSEFASEASQTLGYDVPGFDDLDLALGDPPDFAIVITPPNARTDICDTLINHQIPVLIEKPIERTFSAAKSIVQSFEAASLPLGIVFQHRTRSASSRLKQALIQGDLGEIIHVEMSIPWWRDQDYYDEPGRGSYARDGGGVMISQAIHTLDLALWLCGPVAELQAHMRTTPLHQMEAEDLATALLRFASGATGVISATTAAYPGGAERIGIMSTKAQVRLTGDRLEINYHDGRRIDETTQSTGTGGGADPMAFTHAWHQAAIEDFAQALRQGRDPIAPGIEALRSHAVIDAMERASRSGSTERVQE